MQAEEDSSSTHSTWERSTAPTPAAAAHLSLPLPSRPVGTSPRAPFGQFDRPRGTPRQTGGALILSRDVPPRRAPDQRANLKPLASEEFGRVGRRGRTGPWIGMSGAEERGSA